MDLDQSYRRLIAELYAEQPIIHTCVETLINENEKYKKLASEPIHEELDRPKELSACENFSSVSQKPVKAKCKPKKPSTRHASKKIIEKRRKTFTCYICDKSFESKSHLKEHLKVHTDYAKDLFAEEPLKSLIKKGTDSKESKKIHVLHEELIPQKKLSTCTDISSVKTIHKPKRQGTRAVEKIIEKRLKPFACSICDESFELKSHFKKHLKVHTNGVRNLFAEEPLKSLLNKGTDSKGSKKINVLHEELIPQKKLSMCTDISSVKNIHKPKKPGMRPVEKVIEKRLKTIACTICDKSFELKSQYKEHLKVHTDSVRNLFVEEPLKTLVKKGAGSKESKKIHVLHEELIPQKKLSTCTDISSVTVKTTHKSGTRHVKKVIEKRLKSIACSICDESFELKSQFKEHLKVHTDSVRNLFAEEPLKTLLKKGADGKESKKIHVVNKELILQKKLSTSTDISNVPIKTTHKSGTRHVENSLFKFKQIQVLHEELIPPKELPSCIDRSSATAKSIYKPGTRHVETIIEKKLKPFACHICDKSFKLKPYLKNHLKGHTDSARDLYAEEPLKSLLKKKTDNKESNKTIPKAKKPGTRHVEKIIEEKLETFACSICKKSFARNTYLKKHLKVHARERDFYAEEPLKSLLKKKTVNKINLVKQGVEKVIDKELKPFACGTCDKSFDLQLHLDEHLKLYTEKSLKNLLKKRTENKESDKIDLVHEEINPPKELLSFKDNSSVPVETIQNHKNPGKEPSKTKRTDKKESNKIPVKVKRKRGRKVDKKLKAYACDVCQKTFGMQTNLTKHSKVHTSTMKTFACDKCDKAFSQAPYLREHLKLHSAIKPHVCKTCKKSFAQLKNLNQHLKLHMDVKEYMCDICCKSFGQKMNYIVHLKVHSGHKPFSCEVCAKKFTQKANMQKHMLTHTAQKSYKCELCESSFKHMQTLKLHVLVHTREYLYKCEVCQKSFAYKRNLVKHAKLHGGKRVFKCEVCPKSFVLKTYLNEHMRLHKPVKINRCEVCGYTFLEKSKFNKHLLTHIEEKPHKCAVCGKKFAFIAYIVEHAKEHENYVWQRPSGHSPYLCELCAEPFMDIDKLNEHTLTHVGDQLKSCEICGDCFAINDHLIEHIESHFSNFRDL